MSRRRSEQQKEKRKRKNRLHLVHRYELCVLRLSFLATLRETQIGSRKGAKNRKPKGAKGLEIVNDSRDPILNQVYVEVDQQAESLVR